MTPPWWTPTVEAIVLGILADTAFDRLPVLADAAEDAGLTDGFMLDVFRGRVATVVTQAPAALDSPWRWLPTEDFPVARRPRDRVYQDGFAFARQTVEKWAVEYGLACGRCGKPAHVFAFHPGYAVQCYEPDCGWWYYL